MIKHEDVVCEVIRIPQNASISRTAKTVVQSILLETIMEPPPPNDQESRSFVMAVCEAVASRTRLYT